MGFAWLEAEKAVKSFLCLVLCLFVSRVWSYEQVKCEENLCWRFDGVHSNATGWDGSNFDRPEGKDHMPLSEREEQDLTVRSADINDDPAYSIKVEIKNITHRNVRGGISSDYSVQVAWTIDVPDIVKIKAVACTVFINSYRDTIMTTTKDELDKGYMEFILTQDLLFAKRQKAKAKCEAIADEVETSFNIS